MDFDYNFDCPMIFYDLSKPIQECDGIDEWFSTPHEAPPKSFSDELFFAELEKRDEMRRKSKNSFDKNRNSTLLDKRKRSMTTERSDTPNRREALTSVSSHGLQSKPFRNKSLTSDPAKANPLKRCASPSFVSRGENVDTTNDLEEMIMNHNNSVKTKLETEAPADGISNADKRRKTSTTSSSGSNTNYATRSKVTSSIQLSKPAQSLAITKSTKSVLKNPKTLAPSSSSAPSSRPSTASASTKTTRLTTTSASTSSSASTSMKAKRAAPTSSTNIGKKSKPSDDDADLKELEELLREHNAKFAPIPIYEPPKHSIRDVRKWEKKNGKAWSDLKPEEREKVNQEITYLKANNLL